MAVIGVAGRGDVDSMDEFVERHDLRHFPQLADTELVLWDRVGVVGQPAWAFIDGQTGEAELVLGTLPVAEVERRLDLLIGEGT